MFLIAGCAAPLADDGEVADGEVADGELALGAEGDAVEAVNDFLFRYGYFPNDHLAEQFQDWVPAVPEGPADMRVFDERTEEAVALFQRAHGLPDSGIVDEETSKLMTAPRCGNPVYDAGSADDKWHHDAQWSSPYALGGTYTYRVIGTPTNPDGTPSWTAAQAKQAVRAAFDVWERDIGVSFVETSGGSHIIINFTPIDGSGNTLARVFNNYWGGSRYSMEVDTAENWQYAGVPNVGRTLVHEIGHILGFDHSSINIPGNEAVMFPTGNVFSTAPVVLADDDLTATTFRYRQWVEQPGSARDIGVGEAGIWAIGTVSAFGGYGIYRFNGVSWVPIDGGAVRVAVGDEAWVINSSGAIYKRQGTTVWNRSGTYWQNMYASSRATDIGVAAGQNPWIISDEPRGAGGYAIRRYDGAAWQEAGGAAVRISVGDNGTVYVVNAQGQVYQRMGTTPSNPLGSSWQRQGALANNIWGNETGFALDVSVSRSGVAWVTGTADGNWMTFVRQTQSATSFGAPPAVAFDRWVPVQGHASNIAAYVAHDPWVVTPDGRLARRVPGN